jgi:CheY-like chemotaxis protein
MENRPLFLIAEDDPDDQLLLREVIEIVCDLTLETHFVWNGVELMNFLKTEMRGKPNLILLDLNMPGKDGRTTLREIKADPNLAGIPVVVLTTSQNEADLHYCQNYGVSEYYHKPSSIIELQEILRSLCTNYLN